MKKVVAVEPRLESKEADLHELSAYNAWKSLGGATCSHIKSPRFFNRILYHYQFPHIRMSEKEARLVFVSGACPLYMSFPDYVGYEVIPLFWDCWPDSYERVKKYIRNNYVRVAYFTSSQTAERMQDYFPNLHIGFIPEGIDPLLYSMGTDLKNRKIDVLEYGRSNLIDISGVSNEYKYLKSNGKERLFSTNRELYQALAATKITLAFPRSMTHPEKAGDIETLTQRYWECMLSRIVMVGKTPKELKDLLGYDPVIDVIWNRPTEQIIDILKHIEDYQQLVNRNRENALKYGNWKLRMETIRMDLKDMGYIID